MRYEERKKVGGLPNISKINVHDKVNRTIEKKEEEE